MSLLTPHRPDVAGGRPAATRGGLAVKLGVALALAFGVVVRLHSQSALWLDEALSVNIARLPLSELPAALKQDGAPPLYYLLLHGWMSVFGTGTSAVRALSTVFALAALPLAWLVGTRLRDRTTGWVAVLLFAALPFLVRYATETRMYAMVTVLVLLGVLALQAALREPTVRRLVPVSVVSGLLLLTHYWAIYLLAVTGGLLLVLAVRGPVQRAARRCAVALAAGGVLFLPWVPIFLFQAAHTGTPWVRPPKPVGLLDTLETWTGGNTLAGGVLLLLLVGFALLALVGRRTADGVTLGRPLNPVGSVLVLVALGTLLLGLALALLTSAGYAPRYSSVAVVPFLLAAALGSAALPPRARTIAVGVAVVCGLLGSAQLPLSHKRTQAAKVAKPLRAGLAPGDLVVYCPDQNGPAVSRLLPPGTDQVVYPTLGAPERVDWVDYAERNAKASPTEFARTVLARTDGAIWLVTRSGHRTFGTQCEQLDAALETARGGRQLVVAKRSSYNERFDLVRYPAASASAARP